MLENTEAAIRKEKSRETGNMGYTKRRKTKHKHNTTCAGHHSTQTNTDNLNKTCALLQTSSLAKGYDPLYSSSSLKSLDGFS